MISKNKKEEKANSKLFITLQTIQCAYGVFEPWVMKHFKSTLKLNVLTIRYNKIC